MLFDLRVVLAACLATLFFAAMGLGLVMGLRSPFKASAGYTMNEGASMPAPGLPKNRGYPLPVITPKPEVTGSIADAPEAAKENAPAEEKAPSISSLIEQDKALQAKSAKAPAKAAHAKELAKKAAVKKKKVHHAKKKQPFKPASPFSVFSTTTNPTTTAQ